MKKKGAELVLTSKTPKVYKSRELNNASFGNFTLNDYQVFLHLLSKVGGVDGRGKYLQFDKIDREYTLTAKEFSEVFNTDLSGSYKLLRSACEKLQAATIFLDQGALPEIWNINVCSMAKYNESEGYISIEFSDRIMPYIAQVREATHGFVLYNIKEISNFGSIYATRLYELLQEYKHTGWAQKSVEQLRTVFAVGELLREYKDFKKRTFVHACNEINRHYPEMRLTFEEIKEGRKIGFVKFLFRKIEVRKFTDPQTGRVSNVYIKPQMTKPKLRKNHAQGMLPLFESLKNFPILSDIVSKK